MLTFSYRSPKTEVRESKIHGRGLFAIADIAKDEIVAVKGGHIVDRKTLRQKITPRLGSVEIQIDDDLFIAPVADDERELSMLYSNHSRVARHWLAGFGVLGFGLGVGIVGYHYIAGLSWIDSLLNASMILGGMGPVDPLKTDVAKIFASLYALFSGLAFIGIVSVLLAPFVHRLLHRVHAEER